MGNSESVDDLLGRFVSDHILTLDHSDNEEYWNDLFSSISAIQGRLDTPVLCNQLAKNNVTTRNFSKLVIQVIQRLKRCSIPVPDPQELEETYTHNTTNAVILLRSFSHYFIIHCDPVTLQLHFSSKSDQQNILLAGPLLSCLSKFIISNEPNTDEQKNLLLEVLTLYIVLLSTRLHAAVGESYPQLFRDELFQLESFSVLQITQRLLEYFVHDELRMYRKPKGLFSTLVSLSWAAYGMMFMDESSKDHHNIGDLSLFLLLILVAETRQNPFLNALSSCYDVNFLLHSSGELENSIHISYSQLYDTISNLLSGNGGSGALLLLSHLLQNNSLFLSYVLSRSDLENLVVPLLRIMYVSVTDTQSQYTIDHVLIISVILLLFTYDTAFISHSQHHKLHSVLWHKEHTLLDVSIADLIFTILLRVLHVNLTKFKDRVLQINGMAVLINMSSTFEKMDSHTAHRIFALLDLLSRRYFKWTDIEHSPKEEKHTDMQQANLYAKFLQMIFEMLNICLYFGLAKNPHFIYALLYSKESLRKFSVDSNFSQCVVNLQIVIDFFENRLSAVDFEFAEYSSNTVLDVITAGALDWKNIYFTYRVSDQRYEFPSSLSKTEFYVPQTWMTVLSSIPLWPHPITFPLFSAHHPFRLSRSLRLQLQKMHETANTTTNKKTTPIVDI